MEKRKRRMRRNLRRYKRRKFFKEYGTLLFRILITSLIAIPTLIFLFIEGWEYSLLYLIPSLICLLSRYILKKKRQKRERYSKLKKI